MTAEGGTFDPRAELAELAAAVRAYVEWHADTGATGLLVNSGHDGGPSKGPPNPPGPAPSAAAASRTPAPIAAVVPNFAAPAWATSPPGTAAVAAPRPPPPPEPPKPPAQPVIAAPAQPEAPQPVVEPGADERHTRLALLAEEVRACTRCGLHENRRQTVFSRGDPFSELVFIGEGPGADEDAQGEPFVGASGQLLDRMIAAMGYRRDDVYIANVVKCRPPNNRKPEPAEMATCVPYLAQQLGLVKPRVIVALGGTAMQGLCGTTEGITRLRGKWKVYRGSIPVMPTFHPAYLLRQPAAKREVWLDLQEVMKQLGKSPPAGRG